MIMSRRFLFLLAATVVLLYFSVILFMLNPLHTARGAYTYMNNFHFHKVLKVRWCKPLRWRFPPSPDVVALASSPGSGNTWLRYLLQQVTGIVTGSLYMDHGLRLHGFPAETVCDGSVLVVKTHERLDPNKFKSAILLIRDPRDALLADFHRRLRGHIGTAPKSAFEKRTNGNNVSDWARYVTSELESWEKLNKMWLTEFPGPVHVVFYEVLVRDMKKTLYGILDFLNYNVTEADMNCALDNREGIYRRRKKLKDFDPYTPEMYKALDDARNRILDIIKQSKDSQRSLRTETMRVI